MCVFLDTSLKLLVVLIVKEIDESVSDIYTDARSESRVPLDEQIYVPCDERVGTAVIPAPSLPNLGGHFKSVAEIYGLVGLDHAGQLAQQAKEMINSDSAAMPRFPVPQVISGDVNCLIISIKTIHPMQGSRPLVFTFSVLFCTMSYKNMQHHVRTLLLLQ